MQRLAGLPWIFINCHPVNSVGRAPVNQAGGCGFKPWPDQQLGSLKNWWDHAGCDVRYCLSSDGRVIGLSRWAVGLVSFILPFIGQTEADVKEPTVLFEKGKGCFPSVVSCLILHILHVMGQVCYGKLINGLDSGCWWPPCTLTSELTVNVLTSKKDTCVVLRSHPRHFLIFFISNMELTQTLPFFFRYQGKSQLTLTWQRWHLYAWRLIMISDHVWILCRYGPGRNAVKSCK